ncbi:hypothetical protein [Paraburkholderia acidisoli]|uniref:Uncharacterized protein n=1 Tax=Paraburkholderia acidisoli TaxID=2571748 RepID=A0A7Z2GR09_9BURK|nr:hypothetical protein [Paraburkholderia acidisoli]QGZ66377.1 hypothetical protein FAZ98_31825 [Paraburkholderia acidisoli]
MNWILLVMIHAGMMSHNDDIAITSARFYQQNACQTAGQSVEQKLHDTYQHVDFVCIHDADGK